MIMEISQSDFGQFINSNLILYFYASWCEPCHKMADLLSKYANYGIFNILKINIDNNPDITRNYNVQTLPSLVFLKKGNVVDMTNQLLSKHELDEKIKIFL